MSHNKYLGIIAIAGLLSWSGFSLVVTKLNPFESTNIALALFFITLFMGLMCAFAVTGFYFRVWINKNEIYYHHINISMRQGILLSFIGIAALAFQLIGVLTWWTGILLVCLVLLIELYFTIRT